MPRIDTPQSAEQLAARPRVESLSDAEKAAQVIFDRNFDEAMVTFPETTFTDPDAGAGVFGKGTVPVNEHTTIELERNNALRNVTVVTEIVVMIDGKDYPGTERISFAGHGHGLSIGTYASVEIDGHSRDIILRHYTAGGLLAPVESNGGGKLDAFSNLCGTILTPR